MYLSQSTQTFILFFTIFLTILIGLFFLFNHNKQVKLSLANAVQTSILIVGFLTLIVFGGSYYFILSDAQPSTQPLKDALSITASFFGGFATLIAAYIASRMFNDWRDEHNNTTLSAEALRIFRSLEVYKLRIQTYSSSICNPNNLNNIFTEPYQTIFNKEMVLSNEIRELKLLQDSYMIDIRMLLGLLPNNDKKETTQSIGLDNAMNCFSPYFVFVQKNYIEKKGSIDSTLITNTLVFQDKILEKISDIQKKLKKFIIIDGSK